MGFVLMDGNNNIPGRLRILQMIMRRNVQNGRSNK